MKTFYTFHVLQLSVTRIGFDLAILGLKLSMGVQNGALYVSLSFLEPRKRSWFWQLK